MWRVTRDDVEKAVADKVDLLIDPWSGKIEAPPEHLLPGAQVQKGYEGVFGVGMEQWSRRQDRSHS